MSIIQSLTLETAAFGEFNFVLSNGSALIVHCSNRLSYIIRQAPFGAANLKDQDVVVDFGALTTSEDRVAIVATDPLTANESWTRLTPGTLAMFQHGNLIISMTTVAYDGPVTTV